MSAFNFELYDDSKCVSKNGDTCTYNEGAFYFGNHYYSDNDGTSIGESLDNNDGGIAGFIGPNHEYFLYCGSKYAEIAVVKFNQDTDMWEDCASLQFDPEEDASPSGFFKHIWFTNNELALIFEPKKMHADIMQHEDLGLGNDCIKLDLSTGKFTGITYEQRIVQGHSIVNKDSKWPKIKFSLFLLDNINAGIWVTAIWAWLYWLFTQINKHVSRVARHSVTRQVVT